MKLVMAKDLHEGMVVADNVFESKSSSLPLLSKGVVLNEDFIRSINKYGIPWLYVEVPDDYRGMVGEVLELGAVDRDIVFDGKVQVNGDVNGKVRIDAGESIIIKGSVMESCLITSRTGAIRIGGEVNGTRGGRVRIDSSQKIEVKTASFADLKANGEVRISGNFSDSTVTARGDIGVEGKAFRSELYSMSKIVVGECGNAAGESILLIVRPYECRALFNELLKIDAGVSGLLKEKERLQNVIGLIKRLGKAVEQLSREKKLELAAGVKRFKEIEAEMDALQARKVEIKAELEGHLGLKRIMVNGTVFPGTKVTIENSRFVMTEEDRRLAFCVRDFKVVPFPYSGSF